MYTKVLVGFIALFVLNGVLAQFSGYGGFDKDKLLEEEEKDYYDAPHYSYHYNVHDGKTGDVKTQGESREGDVVKGFYTLIEADGTTREVHYTADKHNGFNAVVKKSGTPVDHQPQYSKPKYEGFF